MTDKLDKLLAKLESIELSPDDMHVFEQDEVEGIHELLAFRVELVEVASKRRRFNAATSLASDYSNTLRYIAGAITAWLLLQSQVGQALLKVFGDGP